MNKFQILLVLAAAFFTVQGQVLADEAVTENIYAETQETAGTESLDFLDEAAEESEIAAEESEEAVKEPEGVRL